MVAVGCGGGLEAAGNAELAHDVGHVHAGGFLADVEGSGDLGVGQAVAEQRDDLAFPRRQTDGVWWRRGGRCGEVDATPAGEGGDLGAHRRCREPTRGLPGVLQCGGCFPPLAAGEQASGLLQAGLACEVRAGALVGRDLVPQGRVGRAGDAAELGGCEGFEQREHGAVAAPGADDPGHCVEGGGLDVLGAGQGGCGVGPVRGEPGGVEGVGLDADRQGGDAEVTGHVVAAGGDLQCVADPRCRAHQVATGGGDRGIQRCQIGPVVGVAGGTGDRGHGGEVGSGGGEVAAGQRDPAAGYQDPNHAPELGFVVERRARADLDLVPAAELVQRLQDATQDGRRGRPGQAQRRAGHAFLPGPQRLLGLPGFGERGCEIDMAPRRLGVIADLPGDPQAGSDHLDPVGATAKGGQAGAQGVAGVRLLARAPTAWATATACSA